MTAKGKAKASAPTHGSGRGSRSAARLAAVQALYQIDLTGGSPSAVIAEFTAHRLKAEEESAPLGPADEALFLDIMRGVSMRKDEIDPLIAGLLAAGWKLERLDIILRAILRAAAYELLARLDIPYEVVIDEYVGIAAAFFTEKEPAFVNGLLDRLAGRLRRPPEDEGGKAETDDGSAGIG